MKKTIAIAFIAIFTVLTYGTKIRSQVRANTDNGLVKVLSPYNSTTTADRFIKILKAKELTIFNRIDHTENANTVGQDLRPTTLVIFGNPKVGTPLMQCNQTVGIDLPQKVLFWTDESGQSWVSYNDPNYLSNRHNLEGCEEVIKKVSGVLNSLTETVTKE